jgi:hypothetical protein
LLCVEYGEDAETRDRPATHVPFMEALGGYEPFGFAESKFSRCGLVPWSEEKQLRHFDNIVYIPREVLCSLPSTLFVSKQRSRIV